VKKRPRDPARMQLHAIAIARCVLPVPVPPVKTTLCCWAMKNPAGEIAHQRLIDRRVLEGEVFDVLGQRPLGDRELVLDRADLVLQEIADETLRFVLALDRRGQRLVVGAPHPLELEAAHYVEDFGSFHGLSAPDLIVSGAVGDRRMT
jgi:hypothetical protein